MTISIKELFCDEVKPLDSEFDIEEIMLLISGLDKKVEWLKDLKRSRIGRIDEDVEKLESRKIKLREIVVATLKKFEKNSLSFPGVGKVSVKAAKGTWVVEDEANLIDWLKKTLDISTLESVCSTKTIIAKGELNKVLDGREKIGEDIPSNLIKRGEAKESLSVTIDKSLTETEKVRDIVQSVEDLDMSDLDELKI